MPSTAGKKKRPMNDGLTDKESKDLQDKLEGDTEHYKRGGRVRGDGPGETFKSKKAKGAHERSEPLTERRLEFQKAGKMATGGVVRGAGAAIRGKRFNGAS